MGAIAAGSGGSSSRGSPKSDSEIIPPGQVLEFSLLYSQNCAGCHGASGKGGAAIALANPVFLAIADDSVIRRTTANGVPGTSMPAFAQSAGAMLTDKQIDALVNGIRSWAKSDILNNVIPPPYSSETPGDPLRGAEAYRIYCSSCHGVYGRGGNKAGSIVDTAYLALVSDQELRTICHCRSPGIGCTGLAR